MRCRFHFLASLIMYLSASVATAQQLFEPPSVGEMSLEDLMQVEVKTASRRSESLWEAPQVMSVLTREHLEGFGVKNLKDALTLVVSVYPQSGFDVRDSASAAMRGQLSSSVDKHVLILVDGVPLRETSLEGLNTAVFRSFPIEMVERIEVVRGPGSVLYGSGAFEGVVNIQLRQFRDHRSSVSMAYGSLDEKVLEASTYRKFDKGSAFFAGQFDEVQGWQPSHQGTSGLEDDIDWNHRAYGVLMGVDYQNYQVRFSRFEGHEMVLNADDLSDLTLEEQGHSRDQVSVKAEYQLGNSWSLTADYIHARHHVSLSSNTSVNDGRRDIADVYVKGPVADGVHLLVGSVVDGARIEFETTGMSVDRTWVSHYAQLDLEVTDWLKIFGGAQFNDPDLGSYKMSPRAGAVVQLSRRSGVKLSYGEAFRSPSAVETDLAADSSGFGPEFINTADVQLFYRSGRGYAAITAYRSWQSETITYRISPVGFANEGAARYQGVEVEGEYQLASGARALGSVSYQESENSDGVSDFRKFPNWMAKAGVYHRFSQDLSAGVFQVFYSKIDPASTRNSSAVQANPEGKAYSDLNVNITYSLRRHDLPGKISLRAENLLEADDIYAPDINDSGDAINTFPQRPGRNFLLTYKLEF